jgi:CheY-like chemotaxis protein
MPLADTPAEVAPEPKRAPALALAAQMPGGAGERTVLYIEDDPANARLMSELFAEDPRLKLMLTMQGTLGVEMARRHLPDMILLDNHLPDIDGDEVIRRLRGDSATRPIPVVVVSADATEEQRVRMMSLGAVNYLTKPLQLNSVLSAVWEILDSPVMALNAGEGRA